MGLILEALMIVLFGISWPFNIIKSIKTKTAKGKSLYFLLFVEAGYICGIISKILLNNVTWVMIFYSINLVMVGADIIMYFINHHRDSIKDRERLDNRLMNA